MPNPDGTMTPEERRQTLLATAPVNFARGGLAGGGTGIDPAMVNGGGAWAADDANSVQSELFGSLSDSQAQNKMQGDFGLGSNNNAQTSAMIGNAEATGAKYGGQFGADATAAGAASAAAGARGIAPYQASMGGYNNALAAGGLDRQKQQSSYDALTALAGNNDLRSLGYDNTLTKFANQGPGPSAAEAQLTQATDANTQNTLALARSGRGMGGSQAALRGAMAQNATTQQGAVGQMAELRANENTAFQAQKLNALNSAQTQKLNAFTAAGAQNLNTLNAAGGVANSMVGTDLNRATTSLAGTQYQTDTALKGTQLNDAASQAWAAQQQAAQQQGLGAEMGAQTQDLNINTSALAGRESQWASANQTHGIDTGNATQAGIADANRTQAYIGAGTAAAGGVISAAASDERAKTNIQPLTNTPPATVVPNGPAPSPQAADSGGGFASKSAADAAQRSATGAAVGGAAGSVVGGAVGSLAGPVGTAVGGIAGNFAGKAIGKVFSDVRNKTNVQPLTAAGNANDEPSTLSSAAGALGQGMNAGAKYLQRQESRDPFAALQEIAAKYGAGGVAKDPKQATQYAKVPTARFADVKGSASGIFSRSTDHPILSKGDALLADSARGAPPSSYQYKDPADGQGTFVGPMAQDLAKNPVTAPAVGQGPDGKLNVDGSRAALAALSQNHSQQNQLDALYAMLDDSKKRELQRSSGGLDSVGNPFLSAGAR